MVGITEISAIVAAAGVLIGVVYYILDIRQQRVTRRTDLMITLYSMTDSSEYREAASEVLNAQFTDYDDYVKKYGTQRILKVLFPYEMVGTMLFRKQIEPRFISDIWTADWINMLYEKFKPLILGLRRDFGKYNFVGFEYLRDELVKKEPQLEKDWAKYMSRRSLDSQEETHKVKKREQKLQSAS
jgi:hypothetical protein